ncbi:unnamed protein product [Linum tenue]|uniref:Uncharacterized protein n=1 Tax=Linum tenue TaxID=586396 RepID=A0AAV0R4J2_9ROSI|nr:unnamed protein product [Linum tenue]CAI0551427.1 unnamed protein product [Linum tenue]
MQHVLLRCCIHLPGEISAEKKGQSADSTERPSTSDHQHPGGRQVHG